MSDRTLVTISAGLSKPSSTTLLTTRLAQAAVTELSALGLTTDIHAVELREHAHAVVDTLLTGFPTGDLAALLDQVAAADALIVATPLFTTTYSGLLKSFLDILPTDSLIATPVLLGATGGTARHSLALEYSLRPLFTYLRADVATTSVFAATDDWATTDPSTAPLTDRITRGARELAEKVALRKNTGPTDPFAATPSFEQLLRP